MKISHFSSLDNQHLTAEHKMAAPVKILKKRIRNPQVKQVESDLIPQTFTNSTLGEGKTSGPVGSKPDMAKRCKGRHTKKSFFVLWSDH